MNHRQRIGTSALLSSVFVLGLGACDDASIGADLSLNESAPVEPSGASAGPDREDCDDNQLLAGCELAPQAESAPPPEVEREASYQAPVVTGPYVWAANPSSGRVAVIDANSFEIRSGRAGNQPSVVAGLEAATGARRALVINSGGSDASLLELDGDSVAARQVPLHLGADSWSISPDRRFAIAWTDSQKARRLDPTDGFQDITVIQIGDGDALTATRLTVGYRPSAFVFDAQSRRAFGVTEDGVSIVDLTPGAVQLTQLVPLPSTSRVRPDVSITADGARALARLEGSRVLFDIDLTSGATREIDLGGVITDLDLSADGARAVAVIRALAEPDPDPSDAGGSVDAGADAGAAPPSPGTSASQAVFISIPAGLTDPAERRTLTVPGGGAGSVALSTDGARAVLFSNALGSGVVTLVGPDLEYRSVDLIAPVRAVFLTADAAHAIALQDPPRGSIKKGAFSVLSLAAVRAPKLVAADAPAELVALDPGDSTRGIVTVSDPAAGLFGTYFVRMPSLQVDFSPLPSRPLSSGTVPAARKGFVAQEHPEGRITFVDLAEGQSREITGFELSAKVVNE
jgi:hypothetical protein